MVFTDLFTNLGHNLRNIAEVVQSGSSVSEVQAAFVTRLATMYGTVTAEHCSVVGEHLSLWAKLIRS